MSLLIENLQVNYGATRAICGVSLRLEPGEMFFLLGPSGCGKSTLLRTVAGFIEQFEGEILSQGQTLRGVPPHRRDFGMVFQNYALFPHLNVAQNVAFGLDVRQVPAAEKNSRVAEALQMVGLSGYESRRPGELSGGQQQRVALARALVIRPRLLLLDEPLSNLDAKLRWEMREEIRRIHQRTGVTTLYVTHDQKEALALADRMAILRAGKVEALGTPRELYRRPPTRFTAEFLGEINALSGRLAAGAVVATDLGPIPLEAETLPAELAQGKPVLVFCGPESVRLCEPGNEAAASAAHTVLASSGRVCSSAFLGENTLYELELPGGARWRVLRQEHGGKSFQPGATLKLAVDRSAWTVLPE